MALLSSALSLFTASGYMRLAKTAGAESRATVHLAGNEMRATIDRAEDAAKRSVARMGAEIKSSIDKAQNGAMQLLQATSSEVSMLMAGAGIEARHTSKLIELQVEKAINAAARKAELLFDTAAMQTRCAIMLAAEQVRVSSVQISQEVTKNISAAKQEAAALIVQSGKEVRNILSKASIEAKGLIHIAGEEFSSKSLQVLQHAIGETENCMKKTIDLANQRLTGLVEQLTREANGIVINLGEQGRLLIKDTGQEIRIVADEILSKAFSGQQMVIKVAGEEARLTVQQMGKELRSSLYEIPSIAAIAGEQLGRNFAHGLADGLFGVDEVSNIVNSIKNLKGCEKHLTIQDLLHFIRDQHQLEAQKKAVLYKSAIELFNSPSLDVKNRNTCFLFIGLAALNDNGLIEPHRYILSATDFRSEVIAKIPGKSGTLLKEHGRNAIAILSPKPVEQQKILEENRPPVEFEIELEKQKLHNKSLEMDLENVKEENALLQAYHQEEKARASRKKIKLVQKQEEANQKEQQIKELKDSINQLEILVKKQQHEIAFLQ